MAIFAMQMQPTKGKMLTLASTVSSSCQDAFCTSAVPLFLSVGGHTVKEKATHTHHVYFLSIYIYESTEAPWWRSD